VGEALGLGVEGGQRLRWFEAVDQMRETWPIQYLLPDGAHASFRNDVIER
jgi:hypothetical protein